MPWERKTVDEKRKEFVARAVMGEESISALCREYGISRPTGYKWIGRYQNGEDMCDRPHEPYGRPFKTSRDMMCGPLIQRGALGRSDGLW